MVFLGVLQMVDLSGGCRYSDLRNWALQFLGGRVARLGHEFDRKTTHVVHPAPLKRTEKVLAALAAGLWLLQPSFLTASKPASG